VELRLQQGKAPTASSPKLPARAARPSRSGDVSKPRTCGGSFKRQRDVRILDVLVNNAGFSSLSRRVSDRGRISPRIQHQRTRFASRDTGGGTTFRTKRWERDQYRSVASRKTPPMSASTRDKVPWMQSRCAVEGTGPQNIRSTRFPGASRPRGAHTLEFSAPTSKNR